VFRLLLNPNSKKGISVPVSTYATTPQKITIILRLLPATYLRLAVLIANGIPDLG
jgi:hypothetical protein